MKEFLIHVWDMLVTIWQAPEEQFIWLINLLLPQILLFIACWLVVRWMIRKAYPPKAKK